MRITKDITTPRQQPSAVALGFFDGVHLGHRAVIEQTVASARAGGLLPTVFTFSTEGMVPASKSSLTLLQTEQHKEAILEQMGVEEVAIPPFEAFMQLSPLDYVEQLLIGVLHAKVLICGENYRFGKHAAAGVEQLRTLAESHGVELITVPPVLVDGEMISSTRIRQAVRAGDVALAQRLLGAPFAIEGEVVHGKRLGTTIHSPTINLNFPQGFTVPAYGVYLAQVMTPMGQYYGVTNIGIKPTVNADRPNCETYLLDFDGDLYGKTVTVSLLQRLRGEKKFDSVDQLSQQIQRDVKEAKRLTEGE
ncbi:MAG: bifunctional riboflavin kinase/FAD synthetase [Angelakisella sp.]